jgi:hypothetical protein
MISLLIRLLPLIGPALRYADNPQRSYWRLDLIVFTVFVWLCDMAIAHLYFNPLKTEWTVSQTLERTAPIFDNCKRLALAINAQSAGHIKSIS